ncbi:MAG: ROK family protein [Gammaproteobacteria bacterium]|nr:ROK family protein [Gammaproteobacteria bacterium]MCP5137118.1 ROK family protein [Gammaproteobacteria bacterium]
MRIGIDLGGTKTELIALGDDGSERFRRRVNSPRDDYEKTLETVVGLVHEVEDRLGEHGTVGIGTPGAVSPASGQIKNSNSIWLIGKPLREDVSSRLDRPVRLANDADCFALSEATDGAAAGAATMFGVILGTGVGGGVVVNGQLLQGPNAIAGEWGHNPLPWPQAEELPGPACYCGKHGCIETWLSGPGFASDHQSHTGELSDARMLVHRAEQGDTGVLRSLERYADRLARGLATVINVIDPEVIVLGGGMSNTDFLYRRVPELWDKYVFSDRVDTRLMHPLHGDASGVRGAAWLWPKNDG